MLSLYLVLVSTSNGLCDVCFLQLYKDQRRSSENVSHKSSDSDVSDVSAISRTSSASRISSTSYMSIQSERPRGRFRYTHMRSHSELCFFVYYCSCLLFSKGIRNEVIRN